MNKKTQIIYLIGKSGVGKFTIAKSLEKYNYIVCDNQLINNPIFALEKYNGYGDVSKQAWESISKIRSIIFDFISKDSTNNYIFTNVLLEDEGDRNLLKEVEKLTYNRNSVFIPVKLLVSHEEHIKRIQNPSRKKYFKATDINYVNSKDKLINILHPNLIEIDISNLSAEKTAKIIMEWIDKITKK